MKNAQLFKGAVWFTLLTLLTGFSAFYKILTGFSPYDDEGSMMITVAQFLQGRVLYDDVYTVYGPFYYFFNFLVRTITHTAVSHDVVRISTAGLWVLCSLLGARAVWLVTRSLPWSAAAQVGITFGCAFFSNEPGHPQELSMVLVLALILCLAEEREIPTWRMILAGAIVAAMTLVKVNLGTYSAIALAFALLFGFQGGTVVWFLRVATSSVFLVMPLVIMMNRFDQLWVVIYCFVVTAGIAALIISMKRLENEGTQLRDCIAALCGFFVLSFAVLTFIIARGTTPSALWTCLVSANLELFIRLRDWQVPLLSRKYWILWGLLGITTSILMAGKNSFLSDHKLRCLKGIYGAVGLILVFLDYRINAYGVAHIIGFTLPFCWLVLLNPGTSPVKSLPRIFLASLALVQCLYAFPIAGSQLQFSKIPLLLVLIICTADSTEWMATLPGAQSFPTRLLPTLLTLFCVIASGYLAAESYRQYTALPSLGLPGAVLMHVRVDQRENLRFIANRLKEDCDSFEALPGLPSLYFWSGIAPLTGFNIDAWMLSMSDQKQAVVVEALSKRRNACAVYSKALSDFWNRGNANWGNQLLVRYILEEFQVSQAVGDQPDYQFMVRKDRLLPSPSKLP